MRIRVGTLRKLIREVAISPSVARNNKPIDDPLDNESIAKVVSELGRSFDAAVRLDLTVRAMADHYDESTRQLDDAIYEKIKSTAKASSEYVVAAATKTLKNAWAQTHAEQPASSQARQKKAA